MKISNPIAKLGEEKAAEYLINRGYKIIERNFRIGYGEIDIIAIRNNTLIFVEVKTRTSVKFGTPIESITGKKIRILKNTCGFYKSLKTNLPDQMRIDAISVLINSGKFEIEHIENIIDF